MRVPLETEQEELLAIMVEASRSVPRDERQQFIFFEFMGGARLAHPGMVAIGRSEYQAYRGDLETLASRGLIRLNRDRDTYFADVTPEGTHHYEQMQASRGQPIEKTAERAREYMEATGFRRRQEAALVKWEEAERLLWSVDSAKADTTVGHLCREAMQLFAAEVVKTLAESESTGNPQNTVNRVRAAIAARVSSDARRAVAEALVGYWGAVADLCQRQEHGAQREKEALTWEDSRRLVTQTLMVMYELDRELQ